MSVNNAEDLTGIKFNHPKQGKMIVVKRGAPYEGNCDIRVSWDCVNAYGRIINLPARYIKRYMATDKRMKRLTKEN